MPPSRPSKSLPARYHPFRRRQYQGNDESISDNDHLPLNIPLPPAVQPDAPHENAVAIVARGHGGNEIRENGPVYNLVIALLLTISIRLIRFLITQIVLEHILEEKEEDR